MATTAVSKFRTAVKVSTATSAAKTITGISKANPCVVTSSGHGLSVGTVVVIASVAGMTEINGVSAVITAAATGTFTLGGIDSTNWTTYTSGGTATPQTMTIVENATNITRQGEDADEYDATNLQSVRKEKILGLAGEGAITLPCHYDPTGTGQNRVRALIGTDTAVAVSITRSDGKAQAMSVKFKSDNENFSDLHNYEISGVVVAPVARYA